MNHKQKKNKEKKKGQTKMNYWEKDKKYEVKDVKVSTLFGISYFNQRDMDEFFKKSGTHADANEFQCHYTALTGIAKIEKQILLVNVPLVYFNYPQTVSSASVKFELKDVSAKSNELSSYASLLAQDCMKLAFVKQITELFPDIEWVISPMNTIHRHPGRMASFSGTDYDKNPENPGICFPLSEADGSPSFSSIVCKEKDTMKIVHTECRIANGSVEQKNMTYYHGRSYTYVEGYMNTPSTLEKLFNVSDNTSIPDYFTVDRCTTSDDLMKICQMISYKGCTENIVPENVKKEVYASYVGYHGYGERYPTRKFLNGKWVDEDDIEDDVEESKEIPERLEHISKGNTDGGESSNPLKDDDVEEFEVCDVKEPDDETRTDFKGNMIDFIYDSQDEIGQFDLEYLSFTKAKRDILKSVLITELSNDTEEEEYLEKHEYSVIINMACNKGVLQRKREPIQDLEDYL